MGLQMGDMPKIGGELHIRISHIRSFAIQNTLIADSSIFQVAGMLIVCVCACVYMCVCVCVCVRSGSFTSTHMFRLTLNLDILLPCVLMIICSGVCFATVFFLWITCSHSLSIFNFMARMRFVLGATTHMQHWSKCVRLANFSFCITNSSGTAINWMYCRLHWMHAAQHFWGQLEQLINLVQESLPLGRDILRIPAVGLMPHLL